MSTRISDEYQNQLRYLINRYIFDTCYAPQCEELATLSNTSVEEVELGLKALADNHALVLHPNSVSIWVAHPFALFPTLFWVKTKDKQWWGNCAWCSFGIAQLTNEDTDIFTKLDGHIESLTIHVRDNKIVETDYVVHMPLPVNKLWDNVIYTCANILIFKTENDIDQWCKHHNKPKGVALSVEQLWSLSKLWYGNYLDPNFKRKSKQLAESIFTQVGLIGDFWKF
ncbi:unnamed protein product [Didymodactylos carnosus]|uniref:Alkylmercury lyase n=1 Tax=Didymodactylos carnosus TaxID=1234261 RepID=A0A814MK27_9BILA|nr:unnamed protein product [Didymodactylos carnosus]CAF1266351.1 unnamed protein product [Didymodactylos carnosus]CAF3846294.1 unnamed protein product [Didymodactylos carnosus]CAF4072440.1 unnamed protein product [Didymodactylos carnosus]